MTASTSNRRPSRRERKGAKELLRIGIKAWSYRKDRLPPIEERALNIANEGLKDALQDKNISAKELEIKARILDEALRKSGRALLPQKKLGGKCRNAACCRNRDFGHP